VTAAFGRFWPSAWEVGHPFPPTGPSISAVYANVEDALRLLPQKLHLQHAAGCGRCKGKGCVCVCLDWVAAFFCVFYALNAAFVTATYPIPFPSLRAINIAAALSPKWILRYFCRFRFTQPGKILPKILIGRIRLNCECDYFQRYCS